ncbi:hypothetical protein YB2330_006133 [Saitoella coloradoensis]
MSFDAIFGNVDMNAGDAASGDDLNGLLAAWGAPDSPEQQTVQQHVPMEENGVDDVDAIFGEALGGTPLEDLDGLPTYGQPGPDSGHDEGMGVFGGGQQEFEGLADGEMIDEDNLSDGSLPEEEEATNRPDGYEEETLEEMLMEGKVGGKDAINMDIYNIPDVGGMQLPGQFDRVAGDADDQDLIDQFEAAGQAQGKTKEQMLKELFPSFKPGAILRFTELFAVKPAPVVYVTGKQVKPCVPTRLQLDVEVDDALRLLQASRPAHRGTRAAGLPEHKPPRPTMAQDKSKDEQDEASGPEDSVDVGLYMAVDDWESRIAWDTSVPKRVKPTNINAFTAGDSDLTWIDEEVFEGNLDRVKKVVLDQNDPNLLLDQVKTSNGLKRNFESAFQSGAGALLKRYNISNDEAYDALRADSQSRIRQMLSQLNIEHAPFANRLQCPYYKTRISKAEARSFHRPQLSFMLNHPIHFTKLKKRDKKAKDRMTLQTTKDVSLADNGNFVLVEYSEEHPPVLSNVGMGSKVINYYRKKTETDEYRPKMEIGEPQPLGLQDRSPFWIFGEIEKGEVVPTLYNNMSRAPVFRHENKPTDFLVVRSTDNTGTRYYIRGIKHLYLAGQTFPSIEVPGPHSRKVTTASKNRLKMVVFRLVSKTPNQRLLVRDVTKHFPDQSDTQIRQRLKEFMEYQHTGEDQGYWKLKPSEPLPPEEGVRAMISPETVCLLESMHVGRRYLEDAGYGKTAEEEDNQDESEMSAEQQLAPWIATRNFINATQGKAMLMLNGEGDPTGRGEAFSFIRTSMKGGFRSNTDTAVEDRVDPNDKDKNKSHGYNVRQQQQAYESEIKRIWSAQKTALSNEEEPVGLMEGDFDDANRTEVGTPRSGFGASPHPSVMDDDVMSEMSANSANKVLRITRLVKNAYGDIERKIEIVRDPSVIRAYVRRRQAIEDGASNPESIEVTNDEDANRRRMKLLQDELARLKRNQERRLARKAAKAAGTLYRTPNTGSPATGQGRRCGACGAYGHMRTSRLCPKFDEAAAQGASGAATPAPASPPPQY